MRYSGTFWDWDRKWVEKTWQIRKHSPVSLLGRKKLHLCDICKSTGKRNPFTTSRPWKGIKILTITFWVAVPSSLEKAFKRQSQKQRRISTIKPWKVQGGTLISIKQCILWLRTRLLLITYSNNWNLRLRTVVVMLLFLQETRRRFQRFPGIWNNANVRTPTVPYRTLTVWLKESSGLQKKSIEGKPWIILILTLA